MPRIEENPLGAVQRICIVTPVYNAADYLDEVIASVVMQSGDFILHYHVQDGGSTDGSQAIVQRWRDLIEQGALPILCRQLILTIESTPDFGLYDALNRGFHNALPLGDDVLMGWIGADDRIAPGAFATLTAMRRHVPSARFMTGRTSLLNQPGSVVTLAPLDTISPPCLAAGLHDGRSLPFLMQEGTFWCSDLWHRVGGLDARLRLAGDWDLWRRFGAIAPCATVDSILGFHRRRPGQLSEQMERYYQEVDQVLAGTDPVHGSLLARYRAVSDLYDSLRYDPESLRDSEFVGPAIAYDHSRQAWTHDEDTALPLLPTMVTNRGGAAERIAVQPVAGFGPIEAPLPRYRLAQPHRWLRDRLATGRVRLRRAARYRMVLRYRSWSDDHIVTIHTAGGPLAPMALPAGGHTKDLELETFVHLPAGEQQIELDFERQRDGVSDLLLIDWSLTEQADDEGGASIAGHGNLAPKLLAAPDAPLPRISIVIVALKEVATFVDTLASIADQHYPNFEVIVVGSGGNGTLRAMLALHATQMDRFVDIDEAQDLPAIEVGLAVATGALSAWIESGDLCGDRLLSTVAQEFLLGDFDTIVGLTEVVNPAGRALWREIVAFDGAARQTPARGTFVRAARGKSLLVRASRPHAATLGQTALKAPGAAPALPTQDGLHILLLWSSDEPRRSAARAAERAMLALGHRVTPIEAPECEMHETGDRDDILRLVASYDPDLVFLASPAGAFQREALRRTFPDLLVVDWLNDRSREDDAGRSEPTGLRDASSRIDTWVDTAVFQPGSRWQARRVLDLPPVAFIVMLHLHPLAPHDDAAEMTDILSTLGKAPGVGLILCTGRGAILDRTAARTISLDPRAEDPVMALYCQAADLVIDLSKDRLARQALAEAAACGVLTMCRNADGVLVESVTGLPLRGSEGRSPAHSILGLAEDRATGDAWGASAALIMRSRHSLERLALHLAPLLRTESPEQASPADRLLPAVPRSSGRIHGEDVLHRRNPWDDGWLPLEGFLSDARLARGRSAKGSWALGRQVALLLHVARGGRHAVQIVGCLVIGVSDIRYRVNGAPFEALASLEGGNPAIGELRLDLDLADGLNRLELRFGCGDEHSPLDSVFLLEQIASWPVRAEPDFAARDGKVSLLQGFSHPEGPLPEAKKPNRFRWVIQRTSSFNLASDRSSRRRIAVTVYNPHVDRWFIIRIGGRVAEIRLLERIPDGDPTVIEFTAFLDRGENSVSIETTGLPQRDDAGRNLYFIFESVRISGASEGAAPTADVRNLGHEIAWQCLDGCGSDEGPSPEIGLPYRFRWIRQRIAQICVWAPTAEPMPLRIAVHSDVGGQALIVEDAVGMMLCKSDLGERIAVGVALRFTSYGAAGWRLFNLRIERLVNDANAKVRNPAYILGAVSLDNKDH